MSPAPDRQPQHDAPRLERRGASCFHALLSLFRTPSHEPGRRWSYGRLYVLLGSLPALYVWRGSPVAVQGGVACCLVGLVLLAVGARGWGLYFLAFGAAVLIA